MKRLLYYFGLRARLLLLVFLSLIAPFVLIFYDANQEIRMASAEAEGTALRLVRLAADHHEQLIADAHGLLVFLSKLPLIMKEPAACNALFASLPQQYPGFRNFAVSDPNGNMLCGSLAAVETINFADRPWFRDALESRGFVSSDYLIGKLTKAPALVFALPILDASGNVRAVISTAVSLDWLNRLNEQAQLPEGSVITVMDRNGTILAREPDAERWSGKLYPEAGFTKTILTHKEPSTAEMDGLDGITRLYAFMPLGTRNGLEAAYLAIGIPPETAYKNVLALRRQNLAWVSALAILVLLTAWLGSKFFILNPIKSLVAASQRLASGDFTARTGVPHQPNELSQLATAYDQMAEALQQRESETRQAEGMRAQLAAIVESSQDAIVGRTLEGTVTSWNRGAERLFGYRADEMIGHPIINLVPPDQIETVRRNFETINRGDRIDSYETVRLSKGGEPIHVSITVSPVIDESGKIIGAASITRDITERKRTERKIKALHDINLAITSTLDLSIILRLLLQKIDDLLPYGAAHIRLINPTGAVEPLACRNIDEQAWKGISRANYGALARIIIKSKKPVIVANMHTDDRIRRKDFFRQRGLVSYLGLPLMFNNEVTGILSVFTKNEHEFTNDEISFMETLAKQASIAIHNSQLYEESRMLTQDLLANRSQIRTLVTGLINARDEEAERIARVLHDESGQLLATIYIALDEVAKELPASARAHVQKVKGLLDRVEERLRELSHELHPTILDHLGLQPGLEFLAAQTSKRSGIHITTECLTNGRFSAVLELTLYRVVQEALNNVVRHSKANRVQVRLLEDEALIQCSVQDDGIGFDPKEISGRAGTNSLGLAGIRERVESVNGRFEIFSAPGTGTKLFITLPQEKLNGLPSAAG